MNKSSEKLLVALIETLCNEVFKRPERNWEEEIEFEAGIQNQIDALRYLIEYGED